MSPLDFRQHMRLHPAAVTIIGTGHTPDRAGLTVTAFMSLGAEPPTVICAVNRSAYSCQKIAENQTFSVNTLSSAQIDQARIFSGQEQVFGDERFDPAHWTTGSTGVPVLRNAVMNLECRLVRQIEESTHCLMVGEVIAGQRMPDLAPLLYRDGQWATLREEASA